MFICLWKQPDANNQRFRYQPRREDQLRSLAHMTLGMTHILNISLKVIMATWPLMNTSKKFKESTQKGKYYHSDDTTQRILHVTVHNLNLSDGGTFGCEIDAYMFDPIKEIEVKVYKGMSKLAVVLLSRERHLSLITALVFILPA